MRSRFSHSLATLALACSVLASPHTASPVAPGAQERWARQAPAADHAVRRKVAVLFTGDTEDTDSGKSRNANMINLAANYASLRRRGYHPRDIHVFFPREAVDFIDEQVQSYGPLLEAEKKASILPPTKGSLAALLAGFRHSLDADTELTIVLDGHGDIHSESLDDPRSQNAYLRILAGARRHGERVTLDDGGPGRPPAQAGLYAADLDSLLAGNPAGRITLVLNYCFSGFALDKMHPLPTMNVFASDRGTRTLRNRDSDFGRTLLQCMADGRSDADRDGAVTSQEAYENAQACRKQFISAWIDSTGYFGPVAAQSQRLRALPSCIISQNRVEYEVPHR